MQIVITVGDEGQATAQILGAASPGEPTGYPVAEEGAIDAGAAPEFEEEFEVGSGMPRQDLEAPSGAVPAAAEGETLDGGPAPIGSTEEVAESPGLDAPALATSGYEASAALTVEDEFPIESGPPRLSPVN